MHAAGAPPATVSPAKWPVNSTPRVGRRCSTIRFRTSLYSYSGSHHYSRRSQQCWDKFYKLHKDKFFKDRHYLEKDWRRYFDDEFESSNGKVGCGAGNTIFPLIATFPKLYVHACDFSPKAVTLVKSHANYSSEKMNVFVCDAAKDDLCVNVMPLTVDVVTLPNGHILLRDYAVGDSAQSDMLNLKWVDHIKCIKKKHLIYSAGEGQKRTEIAVGGNGVSLVKKQTLSFFPGTKREEMDLYSHSSFKLLKAED